MSEAYKVSQTRMGIIGVEDNLWSILAILSLLGCCGRGSFSVLYSSPVPQNNLQFHSVFCQLSEVSKT